MSRVFMGQYHFSRHGLEIAGIQVVDGETFVAVAQEGSRFGYIGEIIVDANGDVGVRLPTGGVESVESVDDAVQKIREVPIDHYHRG